MAVEMMPAGGFCSGGPREKTWSVHGRRFDAEKCRRGPAVRLLPRDDAAPLLPTSAFALPVDADVPSALRSDLLGTDRPNLPRPAPAMPVPAAFCGVEGADA